MRLFFWGYTYSGEDPNIQTLPHVSQYSGSKLSGFFLCLFGTLLGSFIIFFASVAIGKHNDMGAIPIIVIFLSFSILAIGGGINQFIKSTMFEITPETIRFRHRSILGKKSWQESLKAYKGLLIRKEGERGVRVTRWVLYLWHTDHDKCILLMQSTKETSVRNRLQPYADIFKLPVLTEDVAK